MKDTWDKPKLFILTPSVSFARNAVAFGVSESGHHVSCTTITRAGGGMNTGCITRNIFPGAASLKGAGPGPAPS